LQTIVVVDAADTELAGDTDVIVLVVHFITRDLPFLVSAVVVAFHAKSDVVQEVSGVGKRVVGLRPGKDRSGGRRAGYDADDHKAE